ncbi:MAG: SagB/ThcOx family dehydrogenase [Phycisphaerae bacterium]|nr:SagB/ThcOx family dehydrogenase [Phycisphaerae bacterium]
MSGVGQEHPKDLPAPVLTGHMPVEEAITKRRSVRDFMDVPLTLKDISQLCWAGQGITDRGRGYRASPSAGALFPIELYIVTAEGVSHYQPAKHRLKPHLTGDVRQALQGAALDQDPIGQAPLCVVIAAAVERTARKYGSRAERYCFIEAGHVAQNILLQATALKLAGVPVGAFEDVKVAKILKLPKDQRVLYLLPIGNPSL